ncbi:AA-TRNA-LIGASE-II domain-containing protein [Aphelenchoides besseyi]|nr:AA-TRNA-LIGASE-II domain-containing protein [Aphelenchoides besseyi]KAI6199979.1 AA-TRNA-LIGASE-II domain-containing protein [Aphelenchoides besseyi]
MKLLTFLRRFANHIETAPSVNRFTTRTHNCGELRSSDKGQKVELYGWLTYKRLNKFLVLRDTYGFVQLYVPKHKQAELETQVAALNYESVIKAIGVVHDRGKDKNPNMITGEIEVHLDKIEVLNQAPSDLPLTPRTDANEQTRLSFRYLDLRTTKMQQNLRLRSNLMHSIRRTLIEDFGFVDIETPTLAQWTPGGAHEFPVPSGKPFTGWFYSLPQSPQIYKQLLMCGGIDRYFQIARCYRDEGAKTDRQPEFTQVDLELSFTTESQVMELVEQMICGSWLAELNHLRPKLPFKRLTYDEVLRDYGTDKPDLRIPWTLFDCTKELQKTPLGVKSKSWTAQAFVARKAVGTVTNSMKREWKRILEGNHTNQNFEIVNFTKKSPFKMFDVQHFIGKNEIDEGDLVVFSWGSDLNNVKQTLGHLRNFVGEAMGIRNENRLEWLWIVEFPLFSRNETGQLETTHHPFTAPKKDHLDDLQAGRNLDQLKAQHYDLVLNGVELGGGSIRINNAELQKHVLKLLNLPSKPLERFVDALSYGAPPHGGFALGLDRYLSLLSNHGSTKGSIRDVIAFPKTKEGKCLTLGAPAQLPSFVLERYGMKVDVENSKTTNNAD